MDVVLIAAMLLVLAALAVVGFGPAVAGRLRRRRSRPARTVAEPSYDPGRERRAERRARELLRSVVSAEEYAMYEELGFVHVLHRDAGVLEEDPGGAGYGYLIYPHRPIVAYDADTGELLSEYCVGFPDGSEPSAGARLPDADDVLAKWMALHGDERTLISDSNMHLPGRQLDPQHVRRDLVRLADWRARQR